METIEIISPIPSKGLGREYLARPQVKDEMNYIELGLVVFDEKGKSKDNLEVVVETTDKEQDVTMECTGNMTNIAVEGVIKKVYYYPFHYEFRNVGENKIKFTCAGKVDEVKLNAPEDTRE